MIAEIVGSVIGTLLAEAMWKLSDLAGRVRAPGLARLLARSALPRTESFG